MTTITLQLPDTTPLAALRDMAERIGCDLRRGQDGTYIARPRHTNEGRVKMPRYHGQYSNADMPGTD